MRRRRECISVYLFFEHIQSSVMDRIGSNSSELPYLVQFFRVSENRSPGFFSGEIPVWNHRSPSRTSCSLCATVQIGSPIATHRDPSALRIALPLRRGSRVFSNRERCNIITSSLHSSVVVAIYGRMFESTRRHFASWIQT